MKDPAPRNEEGGPIPSKGDRIELFRTETCVRIGRRWTVFYSDQVQVLVKWDDGRSESLRPGEDPFRILPREIA
jgi:hypothetical protein